MEEPAVTIFLAGDVMTGRGVDQILPRPSAPKLREPFVTDAREYVRLAEQASGRVPRSVPPPYIWGDALAEWDRMSPCVRLVNLETAVTRADAYDPFKSIHYRMHPENVAPLLEAKLDLCVLANNHVMDFGREGLDETLETLAQAGIHAAGAGRTREEALRPVALPIPGGGRLVVAACADESSGVPPHWAATGHEGGLDLLPDLSEGTADRVAARVSGARARGDIGVISIHWGSNWGYDVPAQHTRFAHRLVDAGVDVVYGHSSHHPRPVEVYRGRLILYGCGDFIDDYEGISGYETYRGDLVLMFFAALEPASGRLVTLRMTPMQIRRLRLNRASAADTRWLCDTLDGVSRRFGGRIEIAPDGALMLRGRRMAGPPAV